MSQVASAPSPQQVADPYKKAWVDQDGELYGLTRFFLDINDDGRADLFVAGTAMFGNAGAPFEVFLREKTYRYVGEVFLDSGSFQLLKSKHNGLRDIKVCSHLSAKECVLRTYMFNGSSYKEGPTRTLDGVHFKEEIEPTPITLEKSGKPLTWVP